MSSIGLTNQGTPFSVLKIIGSLVSYYGLKNSNVVFCFEGTKESHEETLDQSKRNFIYLKMLKKISGFKELNVYQWIDNKEVFLFSLQELKYDGLEKINL
jgi:hypothetical protein